MILLLICGAFYTLVWKGLCAIFEKITGNEDVGKIIAVIVGIILLVVVYVVEE